MFATSNSPTTTALSTANGLRGDYFSGENFESLKLSRIDPTVNFNWGSGSPASNVSNDGFSVRWSGQVQAKYSETYTFSTTTDDGVRLWVNGQQIINQWKNQAATEHRGSITLEAGKKYDIRLEYYEDWGQAVSRLNWASKSQVKEVIPQSYLFQPGNTGSGTTPPPTQTTTPTPTTGGGNGLKGDYFSGKNFESLKLSRIDSTVNFNWGSGSPATGIGNDGFSVRWSGQVQAKYSETYTFSTTTDDGVRLWVNGQQIINQWKNQSATEYRGSISLQAGRKYDIKLEYYEDGGQAVSRLNWASKSQVKEVIPRSHLFASGDQAVLPPSPTPDPVPLLPTVSASGNFQVRGSKIYDPNGKEFIVKGTYVNGYGSFWERETTQDVSKIVDVWKFNTVRVGVNLHPVEWQGQYVPQFTVNNDLDKIVQAFTSRGVVVLFVFADREGWDTPDSKVDAKITELAAKYRNNPYVWYDLYNEPGPVKPTTASLDGWVRNYRRLIDLVRRQGNNNIVMVEGSAYGQDAGNWDGELVPTNNSSILQAGDRVREGIDNVVYSIHVYEQWNGPEQRLADYLDRIIAKGFPMVIGEVGHSNNSNFNAIQAVNNLFKVGPSRNVGIISFQWSGGDNNNLALNGNQKGGWTINNYTNPTNLTDYGKLVWEYTHP
jgi:hypothetical protein